MHRAGSLEDPSPKGYTSPLGFPPPTQALVPGLSTVAPPSADQFWSTHTAQTAPLGSRRLVRKEPWGIFNMCTLICHLCLHLHRAPGWNRNLEITWATVAVFGEPGETPFCDKWSLAWGWETRNQKFGGHSDWPLFYPAFYSASVRTRGCLAMRVSW